MVNLVAVQAELSLEDYLTAAAFRQKIMTLTEEAVADLAAAPTLVAFPEAIGFPLLLTLDNPRLKRDGGVLGAAFTFARARWQEVLRTALRYRSFGPSAFFLWRALPAFRAYHDAFSEAARTFNVTVVAGSSFLPRVEKEASRGGLHVTDPGVYNVAFTFGPAGTLLGRTGKAYLTRGLESTIGLKRAPLETLCPFETPVGRLGVAVCLDGFHSTVVEHLDGLGTQIVVQPSANFAPWRRLWPADASLTEGEAWLGRGLRQQIQGRSHVQVGVNPMLVGDLWDLQARGRSSIVVNRRYHPDTELEGYLGLLALAETSDKEGWVKVGLELKATPSNPVPNSVKGV